MKSILIVTVSHKAKDVRLYHKIAKTLAVEYRVTILHNQEQAIARDDNIDLIAMNKLSKKQFLSMAIATVAQMTPDVVVVVEPILLILTKVFPQIKIVYDCHEFFGLAQKEKSSNRLRQYVEAKIHGDLEKQTIPKLHACITVNDILSEKYRQLGTESYTIPNYPILKETGYSEQQKTYDFIYVGGLSPMRGITHIIKATKVVSNEFANVRVIIIGREQIDGYFNDCKALVEELGLADNVILKEEIPYTEVGDYLARSKCGLCMLSPEITRYKYALPIKLLEYLEAGLLVVTNNFPVNMQLYKKSDGIFTTEYKIGAMANTMIRSIRYSDNKQQKHKDKVQRLIREEFNWSVLERPLLDIFAKLTNTDKKAMLIAYFFPPLGGAGVQRPLKFVKYAKELGWNFDILTVKDIMFHSYDETFLKEINNTILRADSLDLMSIAKKLKLFKKQEIDGNSKTYFQTSEFKKKLIKSFFFMDDKIGWFVPALLKAINSFVKHKYSYILVTIYPVSSLLVAWALSKIFNVPFFIDYRDHWTLSSYFDFSNDFSREQYAKLEKYFLEEARGVLTIGEVMKQELVDNFNISASKIEVMYNGFDNKDFEKADYKANDKIIISYIGNMYKHRTSRYFLQAVRELIEEGQLEKEKLQLNYMGNYYIEEMNVIENSGLLDIIKITPQQEHKLAVAEMQKSDILLLLIGSESGKNVLTGKIFEYLKSQRPILGLVPEGGEAQQLLHKVDNPWTSKAEDCEGIKKELLEIIRFVESGAKMDFDISDFSRKAQASKALKFIEARI
jgi:glycosyltransferase involved in cell wall biosynthesis